MSHWCLSDIQPDLIHVGFEGKAENIGSV